MFASKDTLLTRPSGYTIARSVRLRSSASAYFNRTAGTPTSGSIFTHSFWFKRGALGAGTTLISGARPTNFDRIYIQSNDALLYQWNDGTFNLAYVETTQVFRDPSAWYHILIATDTTQATASNRVKIYVNGTQVTALTSTTYPSQNSTSYFNTNAVTLNIGRSTNATLYLDGYLTEINFIDGQALTPSSFGSTNALTGVWQPAKYTGTYGTNGFYLNFSDNSSNTATTIGKDYSGNGNNWTPNNISVTAGVTYDSMVDSPTVSAVSSNYAVLNPLDTNTSPTITNGNLALASTGATWKTARSTFSLPLSSGQFYMELSVTDNSNDCEVGFCSQSQVLAEPFTMATCVAYSFGSGNKYVNGTSSAYGASVAIGDIVGIAYDTNAGTITFYKNNTSQGSITTGWGAGFYSFVYSLYGRSGGTTSGWVNFGQRPFSYTPPTGFVALNTYNLPASTITNGGLYMKPVLYTGDGTTNKSITGVGFQTDFNWTKSRSSASYSHQLSDSVRGFSKYLYSNATNAEGTDATNHIQSVNSDGYVINSGASFNASGVTYVAWNWKAGGTSSSNTNGSITSTVSVGATQGFSVATYTGNGSAGATFGHGLGVAPSFVIIKERGNANGWLCYHISTGNTGYLELDATLAFQTLSTVWNNTTPSSTVVTLGTVSNVNRNGGTFVAYCFAAVAGYSAFGSYTGNGSTDGPFVFTGFRPRFVLVKRTDAADEWAISDSSRNTYNVNNASLFANLSNAESTSNNIADFLSNGFKIRGTPSWSNTNGGTYIYMAFAENPTKYALAR